MVLSQRKYATDLPQEIDLLGAKAIDVPMEPNLDLWKDDEDFEPVLSSKDLLASLFIL